MAVGGNRCGGGVACSTGRKWEVAMMVRRIARMPSQGKIRGRNEKAKLIVAYLASLNINAWSL